MLRKELPGSLSHNDLIDLLPGGLLSYRFEYTNNRPLPAVVPEPIVPVVPLQLPLDEEAGNASDESESLLSVGDCEDSFQSAVSTGAVDHNENDLQIIDPPDNPVVIDVRESGQKRNSGVLGAEIKT